MSDYIYVDNYNIEQKHMIKYKKEFGFEPVIIGMYWNNSELVKQNILNAIETNTPYNELDFLTDEEKKAFEKGELLF